MPTCPKPAFWKCTLYEQAREGQCMWHVSSPITSLLQSKIPTEFEHRIIFKEGTVWALPLLAPCSSWSGHLQAQSCPLWPNEHSQSLCIKNCYFLQWPWKSSASLSSWLPRGTTSIPLFLYLSGPACLDLEGPNQLSRLPDFTTSLWDCVWGSRKAIWLQLWKTLQSSTSKGVLSHITRSQEVEPLRSW